MPAGTSAIDRDLEGVSVPVKIQGLAEDWMADLRNGVHLLHLGVLHPITALEYSMDNM